MIYQELNLAPHLSVEENILLGEEPSRFGWLDRGRRASWRTRALAELRPREHPARRARPGRAPIAEQQIVEIARALVRQPKVLIMDEPTSSLTQADTENLFAVIRRLRERGVSIVYISHFLEECQRVCDRFTVLRDGETVGSGDMPIARLDAHHPADGGPRGDRHLSAHRSTRIGDAGAGVERPRGPRASRARVEPSLCARARSSASPG